MNGNVTPEGITADLESMDRAGLGGFQAFHVTVGIPQGPVDYMSDEWLDLMHHTLREADRLDLEVCLHNCAGWSSSGGPWITPEYSMQRLVWSETTVSGSSSFHDRLAKPEHKLGYYRDIAVLAFPAAAPGNGSREPFRIRDWKGKTGLERDTVCAPDERTAPAHARISRRDLVDLTAQLDAEDRLKWEVPEGDWTILRLGHTTTGVRNHPAPPEGLGLECDKLSRTAAELHWNHAVQPVIDKAGPLSGRVLNNVLIDSYEVHQQNWTRGLGGEFRRRRGYDLFPWLPCLTGRVVESIDVSERFLYDFRRTIADLFNEHYFGHFAEMAHRNGMRLSIEPYSHVGNFNHIEAAGYADIPMGEWWVHYPIEGDGGFYKWTVKLAASAAHTYGRRLVGAEAFTAQPDDAGFVNHPYRLKPLGDFFFCRGVNRYIFHTFAHHPSTEAWPGMTMGRWGSQFHRGNPWWEPGRAWMKYLARCQHMLQEGSFVADLCYYTGEHAPDSGEHRIDMKPRPPAGYDFDLCDTEILMRMEARDGRITLPSGMSYRLLVLPHGPQRPEVLNKIEELVRAGAAVTGPRPVRAPGLSGYPACDDRVKRIAAELWNPENPQHVLAPTPLKDLLAELGVLPDFEVEGLTVRTDAPYPSVDYIHRREDGKDWYFIANTSFEPQTVRARFRCAAPVIEFWDPERGAIEIAADSGGTGDGRTRLTLNLGPAESRFVVFRRTTSPGAVAEVRGTERHERLRLEGPWTVRFPPGRGAPAHIRLDELISWPDHEQAGVKYFSGTAQYEHTFNLSGGGLRDGGRYVLDLGDVDVMAEIILNGENLGILWKPPFSVDITDALRAGKNRIEIRVTNTGANRLIGDERYPPEIAEWHKDRLHGLRIGRFPDWYPDSPPPAARERVTFVPFRHHDRTSKLQASGLQGPIRIFSVSGGGAE
ncbi:glycosyl hydrolase [Kiritimatiella glycovorans]|uniref:Glycosyl hydrolases family 2 n=1 Tax=Kiritimatiella glycovorans TaxID=1307763 RepID=A0A0G3EBI1_9BACT|nr:Glycosyl hydrolases family 2 [Kiritimatiella glycovorans]